jgi:hypothetical protein
VNRLGRLDAVIHHAGVSTAPHPGVNVVAAYLLTARIHRPSAWSTSAAASTPADDPA